MRNMFFSLLLVLVATFMGQLSEAQTAMAADVWIMTEQGGGSVNEWYVQTHRIEEDLEKKMFTVPLT